MPRAIPLARTPILSICILLCVPPCIPPYGSEEVGSLSPRNGRCAHRQCLGCKWGRQITEGSARTVGEGVGGGEGSE
ncbi:hypothetical protein J6590_031303 [Homalodisca vitripennis]|nr:hypothetical protein J6590_031303 [Homalodisca vitripennis]